jgi:hypothetical protein
MAAWDNGAAWDKGLVRDIALQQFCATMPGNPPVRTSFL